MANQQNSQRRVVITGLGILSPMGIGIADFWDNLAAGRSGIARVDQMSYSAAPQNVGGEIKEFTEQTARKTYLRTQRKSIKVMCREIQLGVASASLALQHSGLNVDQIDHERIGVDFGANLMFSPPEILKDAAALCTDDDEGHRFRFEKWGTTGMAGMEPLWLLRFLPNMPACHIGIHADARGPNNSITLDEASGNLALGEASRVILRNTADMMIAGTTGTRLHPVKSIHAAFWDELAELSGPPETWSRPFDRDRNGQVLSEGACSFILEEESHARSRGAEILGTILGIGSSCVINRQGKAAQRTALANAMRSALHDAGLEPSEIGHINAHGLATKQSDIEEALAIHDVFGEGARSIPVTALKSCLGNSGSGCGTLELAGSLLGLRHGVVPVTLNYETPDPQCPLNIVHGEPLPVSNKIVLNINVTRMGQASALIVQVT